MAFQPLVKLHQLYDGYVGAFKIDHLEVLLIQDWDGKRYAFHNRCPHQGAPLTFGKLSEGCIHCPLHGWAFHLSSGRPTLGQPGQLDGIPLVYEGNTIGINL
ncbi:Rieske (2Fe-2S) protein [Marinibactrum halimedae]|uniref:Rieske domain-containing protein n=1 Tax=Marinibactrum halimedae TaxID=1444977 RepID=A0AA37WMQ1_9GAMM|nr:Rieske (2Fe-2S) protein [Marinibactrum halimedae]MCD9458563.1 Rieske (2Fe-2S) protein [Marinibactrum halimedae]GLS26570.1 hypothetical protein GCM10007877_22860 [Marinibactrum halimedae]